MSEFQCYQFRSFDRPLTENERHEVSSWSSRAQVSSHSATFIYHYGDFRYSEEKAVEQYFDAMLYFANWGTRRLLLRLPADLVDADALEPYCTDKEWSDDYIRLEKIAPRLSRLEPPSFTPAQLRAKSAEAKTQRMVAEKKEATKAHLKKMKQFEKEETQMWKTVDFNLSQSSGKAYDLATAVLKDLQDLANYQGKEEAFREKMLGLRQQHARRSALIRRWDKVGL
ncbi:MAG TPA: hypothetical protein PKE06_20950 [Flavilitoribacter sp.]|nr:hypothetical protein [Flavilitoribacter sp.]HMQ88249.1 hypothetical protein [Flavilitoribacter sp.]